MRPGVCADELFDPYWARRCRMLGNALVPCVARGAFEYLARAASVIEPLLLVAPLFGTKLDAVEESELRDVRFPRDATLVPGWTVCAHGARNKNNNEQGATSIDTRVANGPDLVHVPTPRYGNVYGGPASERNLRGTLGVFLVNCEVSTARAIERGASAEVPMHKQIVPNPRYVEWMMGFPEDWTRVAVPTTTDDEPRSRRRAPAANTTNDTATTVDGSEEAAGPQAPQGERVFRRNGMHVLMSDRSLGVRAASVLWRAMSLAERAVFSERARRE
jgi:hypothetical protein